ncbi:MAG: ABC transporter permease, partial [Spirochaetales bacterium]|nr:ABC transporter permease [Spirochaetales bacterium]
MERGVSTMQSLAKRDRIDMLLKIGRQWAVIFLVAELVFFSLMARGFLTLNAFQIIFFFGTAVFLMATAELFVIITGGIDLSVGYVMGLATIVSAKLIAAFSQAGMSSLLSIILGILITMVIGLIPGVINGLLVSRLKVPPFIATFSMLGICHGVSELLIAEKAAKNLPHLA